MSSLSDSKLGELLLLFLQRLLPLGAAQATGGCQLWSAMLVLTLHPVPVILKEALGRTVESVQKRGGTRGIEGTGPKERKLAPTSEGPSIPPAPSVSPSGRCPFSSLPSPSVFSP